MAKAKEKKEPGRGVAGLQNPAANAFVHTQNAKLISLSVQHALNQSSKRDTKAGLELRYTLCTFRRCFQTEHTETACHMMHAEVLGALWH
jgi:hypothetical protein